MENHLLEKIINLLAKQTVRRQQDIPLSADFAPGKVFQLYVGVAGIVKGTDETGGSFSRYFIAGYHPISCKTILSSANGTAATDLAALF